MGSGGTDPCCHLQQAGSAGRPRREDLCAHLLVIHPSWLHSRFLGLWTSRQPAYSLAPTSSVLVALYGQVSPCMSVDAQIAPSPNLHVTYLSESWFPYRFLVIHGLTSRSISSPISLTLKVLPVSLLQWACRLLPLKGLPTALETAEALFHHIKYRLQPWASIHLASMEGLS